MDTSTGKMYGIISGDDFIDENGTQVKIEKVRAKFMKEIPEELVPRLQGMNRKDRREFYRKNKKAFKAIITNKERTTQ